MRMVASSRRTLGALALVTVAGAAWRFATLGVQSYWLDEATTVRDLRHGFGGALDAVVHGEATPPLYYALAWVWSKAFGTGEVGLRALSALLGALLIPVAFAIGRRLAGERAGLVAAALAAANPFLVWYSQEARAYALLALLSAVATLFWIRALQGGGTRDMLVWALAGGAALATHYFAVFVLVPEAALLVARPATRRAAVGPLGLLAAIGLALAPLLAAQRDSRVGWVQEQSLAARIADVVKHWFAGPTGTPVDALALVAILLGTVAIALALRRRRPETTALMAALAAAGGGALVLALAGLDYVLDRYLIAGLVPVLVLAGAGLAGARRAGVAAAVALVLLFAAFSVGPVADPSLRRTDWRTAARHVAALPRPVVISTSTQGSTPLPLYLPRLRRIEQPVSAAELATVLEENAAQPPIGPPFQVAGRWSGPTASVTAFRAAQPAGVDPAPLVAATSSSEGSGAVFLLP